MATLTPHSYKCVSEREPLENLRSSHGLLDSDLEKMFVDTHDAIRFGISEGPDEGKSPMFQERGWEQGEADKPSV